MFLEILIYFLLAIIIAVLAFLWIRQTLREQKWKTAFEKLRKSFEELDEQAKLIIKTDLELNTTQEELDKRLTGLDALQKISRLISTTLDEDEIFLRLNQAILTELGFEKFLVLMYDETSSLRCRLSFGYSQETLEPLRVFLTQNTHILNLLTERQNISSLHLLGLDRNELQKIFSARTYVLTPILEQKNVLGIILAANTAEYSPITEGDEELISILADQIGQSIKNARLFEEVYHSSQSLERKVQDRTRELSLALDEVNRISKTKSEFVSAVSHELRTPLTSIKGYAALLMTGKMGEIPENVRDRLEKINKHSDSLVKFINELLDISRIESGHVSMQRSQHSLAAIIDNIRDLLAPQLKDRNIEFLTEIETPLPLVSIDSSQIERVFINLLGNAIKFTPQNGKIKIRVIPDTEKVTISVSDTGIGMKKEDMANLFTEFYRVENEINQNVKGTGLGLVLAKKIVEAHHGQIWVTSEPNTGTTFSFTLPLPEGGAMKE